MKMNRKFPPFLGLFSLSCGALFAQATTITIQVQDPSGLPISGAAVSLSLPSGQEVAAGRTQAGGGITLAVASGSYRLSVAASGFTTFQGELALHSAETPDRVIELQLGSLATEIEVLASPPAQVAIEEIPKGSLQSGPPRDLAERLKEVPGVLTVRRGGTNLEPVIQGLREHQVAMVVDGSRTFAAGPARMDSGISHVDPARVSSLEVIKGPYALSECAGGLAAVLVKTDPVPVHDKMIFGGSVSSGYSFNGSNRFGHTRFISRRSNDLLLFRDSVWPEARIRDQGFYLTSSKAGEDWGMAAAVRFDAVQAEAGRPSDFFRANASGPLSQKEFNTSVSLTARRNLSPGSGDRESGRQVLF